MTASDAESDAEYGDESGDEDESKGLDAVYESRNLLACALGVATDAPSGWKPAPDAGEEWAIVWIETPFGQISWHVPVHLAVSIGPREADAGYDGYTRLEKNARLAEWAEQGCPMVAGAVETESLLERLAAVEHRQWMHWSKHVAEHEDIPDSLREKWAENWVPYAELDEETRASDRTWAREALAVFAEEAGRDTFE